MSQGARPTLRAAAMLLIVALLLPGSATALEPEGLERRRIDPVAASFDVVILRPLGFVAVVVGAAAFIPVALLTAPNGKDSLKAALELFVTRPADDVFRRRLGDF